MELASPKEIPTTRTNQDGAPVAQFVAPRAEGVFNLPLFSSELPVWARIFPEHLCAGGYLSEIDTQVQRSGEMSQCLLGVADIGAKSKELLSPAVQQEPTGVELSLPGDAVAPPLVEKAMDGISVHEQGTEYLPSSPAAPLLAADHAWTRRLVRMSQGEGGLRTLWLRDYTLDQNEIASLIEMLRRHAESKGAKADRIVINGREVWRAVIAKKGNADGS
ncbi:MAG: hypothetical protein ACTHMO_09040 [Rhodanobacteraceae bacterium]